jgi:hypothetical protein
MRYTQIMSDDKGEDQGKKQKTPKGHKIPVPKRKEFLRDLKKAAKVKPSTPAPLLPSTSPLEHLF